MKSLIIGDKEIIIQGKGNCSDCGAVFVGDPYNTFLAMKKHQVDTGHDVYGNAFDDALTQAAGDAFVDACIEVS